MVLRYESSAANRSAPMLAAPPPPGGVLGREREVTDVVTPPPPPPPFWREIVTCRTEQGRTGGSWQEKGKNGGKENSPTPTVVCMPKNVPRAILQSPQPAPSPRTILSACCSAAKVMVPEALMSRRYMSARMRRSSAGLIRKRGCVCVCVGGGQWRAIGGVDVQAHATTNTRTVSKASGPHLSAGLSCFRSAPSSFWSRPPPCPAPYAQCPHLSAGMSCFSSTTSSFWSSVPLRSVSKLRVERAGVGVGRT